MRTRVKICGITREEDAIAAVEAGADALGFIFSPRSVRVASVEVVKRIVAQVPPFVTPVGVFVNSGVEEIEAIVNETGLRAVQLHGNETSDFVRAISCPHVIKVFRPGPEFRDSEFEGFRGSTLLIDRYAPGIYGGTGELSDWNVALRAKAFGRVILSGGLTPTNVNNAIKTVHPYAVDVSSGVEKSPGIKDEELMVRFIDVVRQSDDRSREQPPFQFQ